MITNWATVPQIIVPTSAAGSSITPSGTAFVNSAYSQITAGVGFDIVVVGAVINCPITLVAYRLDIAKGASSSEVVVATLSSHVETLQGQPYLPLLVPVRVPANTRVAVRLRKSGTSTTAWTVKLLYYRETETLTGTCSDAFMASDATSALRQVSAGAADVVILSDTVSALREVAALVSDGVMLSDACDRLRQALAFCDDALICLDANGALRAVTVLVLDEAKFSDVVQAAAHLTVSVYDSIELSDSASRPNSGKIAGEINSRSPSVGFVTREPGLRIVVRRPNITIERRES